MPNTRQLFQCKIIRFGSKKTLGVMADFKEEIDCPICRNIEYLRKECKPCNGSGKSKGSFLILHPLPHSMQSIYEENIFITGFFGRVHGTGNQDKNGADIMIQYFIPSS